MKKGSRSRRSFGAVKPYVGWLVVLIGLGVLPWVFPSGNAITIMTQMAIAAVFALSYNMLLGQGGMLSFGHAVYSGLGGFVTLHVLKAINQGVFFLPLELLPIVGALGGLLFAIPFGWVSTRRAGVAFAMISLGVAELVAASNAIFPAFFGGESGISASREVPWNLLGFLGIDYLSSRQVFYLAAFWAVLSMVAMRFLVSTPLGRMANAVRDNPERAMFVGYDPRRVRFLQFCLSAFFAGIAGALTAIVYELLNAEALSASASGAVLLMAYIGGIGHFFGPVLGAVLITYMQTSLSAITQGWMLYVGIFFMLIVMYAPRGLAGIIELQYTVWRSGFLLRLLPLYATALIPLTMVLAGAIAMIEMGYRLSSAHSVATADAVHFFFFSWRPDASIAWIVAMGLLLTGIVLLRRAAKRVAERLAEFQADGVNDA